MAAQNPTAAWCLLTLGASAAFLNWVYLYLSWRTGRFHSAIPLIGGVCLGAGALLTPWLWPYAWAAIFLDYGTFAFLPFVPEIALDLWQTSRINLLEEFVGRRGRTTVLVRLYRRGVFTLWWEIKRPPGDRGLGGTGRSGSWHRDAVSLVLDTGTMQAIFEPITVDDRQGWKCSAGFIDTEGDTDLSLEGMGLERKD